MDIRFVTPTGIKDAGPEDLPALLENEDGFVWVDIGGWSDADQRFLAEQFRFHPVALELTATQNRMPMVHGYSDHLFAVVHRPVVVAAGQVRQMEIDLFLAKRYLVTVHQPEDPSWDTLSEVDETLDRMRGGRISPRTPAELTHAILSLVALRQRLLVQDVASRVGDVETKVFGAALNDPESSLNEMFMLRYELLSVRTAAAHCEEVIARARRLPSITSAAADKAFADLQDMFRRVHRMTDSEQEFLTGVIDLYRARTDTKMMIATERLAVLAAVTLPITAIASVYGMNVIVNAHTEPIQLIIVCVIMLAISGYLLRWTKRLGWW